MESGGQGQRSLDLGPIQREGRGLDWLAGGGVEIGRSRLRSVERYRGASTAAPPIMRPGISAASNSAAPAATIPIVATVATRSRPGLAPGHKRACVGPTRFTAEIEVAVRHGFPSVSIAAHGRCTMQGS